VSGSAGPGLEGGLTCLTELAGTLASMVQLARERRWQALPALEAHSASLVERLRGLDPDDLMPLERLQVVRLTLRIRADQEQLTRLLRPQFLHLARRMAESRHAC